ncbi:MAG: hypothetical protein A3F68_05965 [Acidobacteria bacterium RIFCSPLOWO2_12_FULL_54_10]|nr:MAG: hypothetical protein A3F68_05965 [Acidobacteria bacterium RIFCSPLOWO2_12_FULL_54_10]
MGKQETSEKQKRQSADFADGKNKCRSLVAAPFDVAQDKLTRDDTGEKPTMRKALIVATKTWPAC